MTNNSSDREIILETLSFLRGKGGHTVVLGLWEHLNEATRERIKLKLEDNKLVSTHPYDIWSFQITSPGIKLLNDKDELDKDGNIKSRYIIEAQDNEIKTLQHQVLKLQVKHYQLQLPIAIGSLVLGAVLSGVLLLAKSKLEETKSPQQQILKLHLELNRTSLDTTVVDTIHYR